MIQKFVDAWTKNRDLIQSWLEPICLYCDYSDIVKATVKAIALEATGNYGDPKPDFENIHEINDGDYQGTLVYVIPDAVQARRAIDGISERSRARPCDGYRRPIARCASTTGSAIPLRR